MPALLIVSMLSGARPVLAVDGETDTAGADIVVGIAPGSAGNNGDTAQLGVTVENVGPGPAAGVVLLVAGDLYGATVDGLPEGVACIQAAALSCPLGDLQAGQAVALSIVGMLAFECMGSVSVSAASPSTPDPISGNNAATVEFGQGCTEYQPPEDPCLDEYGNWICSECAQGVVDAGDDQVVTEGDLVTLSGYWDTNVSFASWWQASGPETVLSDFGVAAPTFVAPEVDADTTLGFVLYGDGCTPLEDGVLITVLDSPASVICPQPQGFWKNATGSWPVETLAIGSQVFDADDLLAILEMPVRKDARLILAVQLIAARLSLAAGAPSSATPDGLASDVVEAASALLGQAGGTLFARSSAVSSSSADGRTMTRLAAVLEAYAKGLRTEGCAG